MQVWSYHKNFLGSFTLSRRHVQVGMLNCLADADEIVLLLNSASSHPAYAVGEFVECTNTTPPTRCEVMNIILSPGSVGGFRFEAASGATLFAGDLRIFRRLTPEDKKALARIDDKCVERILDDATLTRIRTTLCNVSQLLSGWHADGTAWSEWDESVRQEVVKLQEFLGH